MLTRADEINLLVLVGVLFAAFLLFLILREFFCWYFKINERIRLETRQVNLLILLVKEGRGKTPDETDDLLEKEIGPGPE
jgi:hypothetical protein